MNLQDYLEPANITKRESHLSKGRSIGEQLRPLRPQVIDYDVALIGIPNDTNGTCNKGSAEACNAIREEIYTLKSDFKNLYIADLGNLKAKTVKEIYFILEEITTFLIKNRVIPIFMGGSQDFTLAIYKGLKEAKSKINILCIDQTLDTNNSDDFDHRNYLNGILNDGALQSFGLIGHQTYLYDETILDLNGPLPIHTIRLGELRKQIHKTEPIFRDADMVSVDMGSVRLSDAPGVAYGSPNGLFGEELCQLCRYAGFSDRISTMALFEANLHLDINRQTIKLAAQGLWHFLDGLDKRYKDYPLRDITTYKKFIVQQSDIDQDIVFYNNPMNNRWWIVIDEKTQRIVSCTFDDYTYARSNKIPDIYYKWLKSTMNNTTDK